MALYIIEYMRTRIDLNKEWIFIADNKQINVNIPHTWNAQGSSLVKYKDLPLT